MMSYFEFIILNFVFVVLKYSQIYYKYLQFNKYTELQYHGIKKIVMVFKNDTVVSLNFGILQSPKGNKEKYNSFNPDFWQAYY